MANESRLSITIDSRSAEQQAKDLEKALGALDEAGIRVVGSADRAGKSTAATGRAFNSAGREAAQGASGVDGLNRSLAQTDDQAARTAATLRRVLIAATAGFSVMNVIDTADQWGQYASRIRMATQSADEYDLVQKRMAVSAQLTYRGINETRESFIQLSPVLRDMGLSLDQSIDAVDTFSGLLVVNGANAERGAAAMNALAKSFQRGKVDAEAWMTIYSTVDNIVDLIAESSGKTTTEIRRMGVEGKISAEMLAKALVDGNAQVLDAVREMPTTVRDALQNLNTAFTEYVGWGNEANGITANLALGIGALGDNFETIANSVGVVAAGALAIYTSRTIESTRATVASFAARTVAAKATLDEAQAQAAQTSATLAQIRAMSGLTASHAQVAAATKAHEAALKQLAVAQAGYTRAGTALLGVLGGPVGLGVTAALAAASFLLFSRDADTAKTSTVDLTKSTAELTKAYVASNEAKRAGMLLDAEASLSETAAKAREAAAALQNMVSVNQGLSAQVDITGAIGNAFAQLRVDIDEIGNSSMSAEEKSNALVTTVREMSKVIPKALADELVRAAIKAGESATAVQELTDKVNALRGLMSTPLPTAAIGSDVTGRLSEEFKKVEEQVNRQIALMGKSGRAAQLRYDIEKGEYSKWSDQEKARGLALADTLEAGEKAEEARRKAAAGAGKEAKEIDSLLKSLREQASVLGMTEDQAARYRIEMARGTDAQRQEALALFDKVQAHKAAEQAVKLETDAIREQRNLAAEIAVFRDQQNLAITGMGQGQRRRQELEAEYAIREEFARRRRELDEAQLVETTRMSEDAYRQQVSYLRDVEAEKIAIIRDASIRKLTAEQSWITGAQEALRNYADEAANVYASVGDAVSNAFKGMEDSLVQFVKAGKLDFRSLADSIISDMARIAIQQSITGPLAGALGSLFGGGISAASGFSLSSSLGGGSGATWGSSFSLSGGRANGGPVSAGRMYEVNERGTPELLNVGKRQFLMMGPDGGHVTPLDSSGGAAPASAPSVQVNIINQSSQPVAAKQGPMRMDAIKGWVQDIVLSDLRTNGPMARGIKGIS